MEQYNRPSDPQETRGWEIVKLLNDSLSGDTMQAGVSLSSRKLLAEYFTLETKRPSRLHSAILSCAVKMAIAFPDFHFVPFINIWGLENLRPEDSEAKMSEDGKRFPSLVERMTKAYVYSLMFHTEERMLPDMEEMMRTVLTKKGYQTEEKDGRMMLTTPAIATRVFTKEVRNRKMTFVSLITPDGSEVIAEVHTVTHYKKVRYDDIQNKLFRIILRKSDSGNTRVEAAYLTNENMEDCFPTAVGYVEHIDANHHHIHVYDNESRHLVSSYTTTTNVKEGSYVRFVPVLPKEGNFKTAIICSTVDAEAFGYRNCVVTYLNEEQGYCAWELLPDADGQVHPIVEKGAKESQEPGTKGYINKALCERKGCALPKKDERLKIITFLKRGKDGKKRPVVVDFRH